MEYFEAVGYVVREERKKQHITQADLAKQIGYSSTQDLWCKSIPVKLCRFFCHLRISIPWNKDHVCFFQLIFYENKIFYFFQKLFVHYSYFLSLSYLKQNCLLSKTCTFLSIFLYFSVSYHAFLQDTSLNYLPIF